MMQIAGDLVMKAADFPMAEELAERFEKTLPPGLKDDGQMSPEMQQAQAHMQQMQQVIQQLQAQLHEAESKSQVQIELQRMKEEAASEREELKGVVQILLKRMDQQNANLMASAQEADQALEGIEDPPDGGETQTQNPPSAGFFTPSGAS
jgi:hypothetical protein